MENIFIVSAKLVLVIPVIVGLVHVTRGLGLKRKWAPVVSMLFGIGLLWMTGIELNAVIIQGIIAGLSASGLYSGSKTVIEELD